jgi:hypothetical protein
MANSSMTLPTFMSRTLSANPGCGLPKPKVRTRFEVSPKATFFMWTGEPEEMDRAAPYGLERTTRTFVFSAPDVGVVAGM